MTDAVTPEPQIVTWVWHPDTNTIKAEVHNDGHTIVIATIPADSPDE